MYQKKTTAQWAELYLNQVTRKIDSSSKIILKQESKLMRFIDKIKFWDKVFMTDKVTTLGSTIYVPEELFNRSDKRSILKVIAFETVGIAHRKSLKALWYILYGYPQVFSLLALAPLAGAPMSFLWFLLCLLPTPSPFRYALLLEQYKVWMIFEEFAYVKNKNITIAVRANIANELSSSRTWWCMPWHSKVIKDLMSFRYIEKPSRVHQMVIEFVRHFNLDCF